MRKILTNCRAPIVFLITMWASVFWVWLERSPNLFTALILDRWHIILPVISFIVVIRWISLKYNMRVVRFFSWVMCGLLVLGMLASLSIYFSISIVNNTPDSIKAVSVDLLKNRVRSVTILPGKEKWVVLKNADSLERAKGVGYHILVFNSKGKIYYRDTLIPERLERINTITINDRENKTK